jgi:hypothetical protein
LISLRKPLPIHLPRVLIRRDGIIMLLRIDELFFLRPALINALEAPLEAVLHKSCRNSLAGKIWDCGFSV